MVAVVERASSAISTASAKNGEPQARHERRQHRRAGERRRRVPGRERRARHRGPEPVHGRPGAARRVLDERREQVGHPVRAARARRPRADAAAARARARSRGRRARASRSATARSTASRATRRGGRRSSAGGACQARLSRDELLRALDQLLRVERLADEAAARRARPPRRGALVDLAAEHDHGDRAVALLHALRAAASRRRPASRRRAGRARGAWSSIACERLLAALGLADRVALELEVDAHELAQAGVVVDDEHERAAAPRRPGRSGRRTSRGRGAGSGGGRRACRRPGRGPGPTTCGSSTARRRGTSPPGRASASRARRPVRVCRW